MQRVTVSTDVAALGLWDRAHGDPASTIEDLALRGEVCVVRMGADVGGAVNVFVNEPIPTELRGESVAIADERTIVIRGGGVVVDGVEYFGAGRPRAPNAPVVDVPNGVYRVTIHVTRDEDALPEPRSEKKLRQLLGADRVKHYDRTNRDALLVGLGILLATPLLFFIVTWYDAFAGGLSVFVAFFHVRERMMRANARYQAVAGQIISWRLGSERPLLLIQLRAWDGELIGGPPVSAQ
jgi:hypothetical protein